MMLDLNHSYGYDAETEIEGGISTMDFEREEEISDDVDMMMYGEIEGVHGIRTFDLNHQITTGGLAQENIVGGFLADQDNVVQSTTDMHTFDLNHQTNTGGLAQENIERCLLAGQDEVVQATTTDVHTFDLNHQTTTGEYLTEISSVSYNDLIAQEYIEQSLINYGYDHQTISGMIFSSLPQQYDFQIAEIYTSDLNHQISTIGGLIEIPSYSHDEIIARRNMVLSFLTKSVAGLSEEAILRHLKTRDPKTTDADHDKVCAVCQDDLCRKDEMNEMIAVLDCGHEYHSGCIEQWLLCKNICPLCMRIALALPPPTPGT